jgi:hypothetical protein
MVAELAITLLLAVTFLWLFFGIVLALPHAIAYERQARRYARSWQQRCADWRLGTAMLLRAALREDGPTWLAQAFSHKLALSPDQGTIEQ